MGVWVEKLPLRILVSTIDAEPICVLFSVREKGRQGIITQDSHNRKISRTFSAAMFLSLIFKVLLWLVLQLAFDGQKRKTNPWFPEDF